VLQETNRLKSTKRLSVGSTIVVPVPRGSSKHTLQFNPGSVADDTPPVRTHANGRAKLERALAHAQRRAEDVPDGKKKIIYTVKRGDTIGHIAEWFACRSADVRNWNDIPYGRPIRAGQDLEVYVDDAKVAKYNRINQLSFDEKEKMFRGQRRSVPEQTGDDAGSYLVKEGETLEVIARDHGVTIAQIKRWNNLTSSTIRIGQRLVIHESAENVRIVAQEHPQQPAKSRNGKDVIYVVKKGDTLWEIARAHEVSPEDLKGWNALKKNRIHAGQELVIRK